MQRRAEFLIAVALLAVFFGNCGSASAIDISNCSVLGTQNGFYNLTQDVINSPNVTCMNITANNVTLDCRGKGIDGTDSPNTYGIYANAKINATVKNCNVTDWWYGVYLDSSYNSTFFNNNLTSNQDGMEIMNSRYNNVTFNVIDNVNDGIYMSNSSYNSIGYNDIINSELGISFYSASSSNTIFGGSIKSTSSNVIYVYQSYDNSFRDILVNSTANNIYHFASSDTVFLNVSADRTKITVDAGAVYLKWYVDVLVLTAEGSPLYNANVTGKDKYNVTVFSTATNASGYTQKQNVTEFHQNFTGKFFYSNYTINATRFGYVPNQTSVNVTGNQVATVRLSGIPSPAIDIKTYTLGLVESDILKPGRVVRIRALVDYSLGREYIDNSTVTIKDDAGSVMVNDMLMANISSITNGYLYEYNYTIPGNAGGLWTIDMTSADSFGQKGYGTKKMAIIPVTLQIKLVLNSTSDIIYIPGTGGTAFPGLASAEYSSPDHYYIASYSGDVLKSIVSSSLNPLSVFTEKGSNSYAIGNSQRFSGSMVFLAFSKGKWTAVENRMSSIEKGEFLSSPEPSFGFGLGVKYPVKIVLQYDEIDLNKTLKIQKGFNRLVIERKEASGNKISLEIRRG